MDGIKCCPLAQMGSWKGLVCLELKRHTSAAHSHRRVPYTQALALVRQISSFSVPERYMPKKSLKENPSVSEAGTDAVEIPGSQSSDQQSVRSSADIRLRDTRETGVDNSADISRCLPLDSFQQKHMRNGMVDSVNKIQKIDTRRLKRRALQLPDQDKVSPGSDNMKPAQDGNISERFMQDDAKCAARDYCISLLAMAPQPEAKLRAKMSKRNISADIVDSVIADLQRCGLQNDREYAEIFARCRWNGNAWGPSRIKFELLRRGVSREHVEAGLNCVFLENPEADEEGQGEDGDGRWGMNQKAVDQLVSQALQRWNQGSSLDSNTRKRRMVGWLQRRGFDWNLISDLLKMLEREDRDEGD